MFTGLVEQVGLIAAVVERGDLREFTITAPAWDEPLTPGESIAVDGICLTVAGLADESFSVLAVVPTLERTTAGQWTRGRAVNLERALRADGRLGGHFVQGHVDAVGSVKRVQRAGDDVQLDIQLPAVVAEVTVLHGSLAVDGVSLTVSELPEEDVARVALIPHTLKHTNLARLQRAALVNLEGDLIGRFVIGYLKRWALPALR
jgi:riboflavin synthase